MDYKSTLNASGFALHLPNSIKEHLANPSAVDTNVEYSHPEPFDDRDDRPPKPGSKTNRFPFRLPARLCNALIPYPACVRDFFLNGVEKELEYLHNHHRNQAIRLNELMAELQTTEEVKSAPRSFDINVLKQLARQEYTNRTSIVHQAAFATATRMTNHDLSIVAGQQQSYHVPNVKPTPYLSLLIVIQKLRALMTIKNPKDQSTSLDCILRRHEPELSMFQDESLIYRAKCESFEYIICIVGGHFSVYHSSIGRWFIGPMCYLDYFITVADIVNNLVIISRTPDYSWLAKIADYFEKIVANDAPHNRVVSFMKNFEALLLNSSDYDPAHIINWSPVLENLHDMWVISEEISPTHHDFVEVVLLFTGTSIAPKKGNLLAELLSICRNLDGVQKQEISALHKFIFYAEVDAVAGLKKYLKRVHTPRRSNPESIKNLTRLAKRTFVLAYIRKHGGLPNIKATVAVRNLLELRASRKEYSDILALPLSYWDAITPFKCLDNTLTDDALEFAKDKGALKSKISYNPGDSRKELLQVVEQPGYTLKPLMDRAPFVPAKPEVLLTRSRLEPLDHPFPARLIEKEREQKIEARLFGNASLENKHGLSMVTTRMKKLLSYFPFQMMTPSDSKRKGMLHDAGQAVINEDTYALMLDLEGHNQSMQHTNTSELLEFCGMIFGESGWGELAHYFSALEIFHYDEFLDQVTVSRGQLGGIEGWLNPLWTLHTTLMMQHLMEFGDVEMTDLLVYSDDVLAIFRLAVQNEREMSALFTKVTRHCEKFGMVAKLTQTNFSKNRVTLLRQHFYKGTRADSTLKKMMSISGVSNPQIFSEELEISAISSSAASALELSNHSQSVAFLKNYKMALLLHRIVQRSLRDPEEESMLSIQKLPIKVSSLLWQVRNHGDYVKDPNQSGLMAGFKNDVASYLERTSLGSSDVLEKFPAREIYGFPLATQKFVENADRVTYLLAYDEFMQDLLFFLTYLPSSAGGLGGALHINLCLSGHSEGYSKACTYLYEWIRKFSCNRSFFKEYLEVAMSTDKICELPEDEVRAVNMTWPTFSLTKSASSILSNHIKRLIRSIAQNERVTRLFDLEPEHERLRLELLEVFRGNFHHRVVQFYGESSSQHFLDLLTRKVETSSSLLSQIKNIDGLRYGLAHRVEMNVRNSARTTGKIPFKISITNDLVESLVTYRSMIYPKISFIEVEEPLYDFRLRTVYNDDYIARNYVGSPEHYQGNLLVKNKPQYGNETRYKGDLLDDDRMIGQKEEMLSARLVAITKWLIAKSGISMSAVEEYSGLDVVKACDLVLQTISRKRFAELHQYAPFEVGGEILHRIPNMRFNEVTYIRTEPTASVREYCELNQVTISDLQLEDSNINFDYLRLRITLMHMQLNKSAKTQVYSKRYILSSRSGIKDVQFVAPKECEFEPSRDYKCYLDISCHEFDTYRFRYMSMTYLTVEQMYDQGIITTQDDEESVQRSLDEVTNEMIYSYYRSLNREFMIASPMMFVEDTWLPLISKIRLINPALHSMGSDAVRDRIKTTIADRVTKRSVRVSLRTDDMALQQIQRLIFDALEDTSETLDQAEAASTEIRRMEAITRIKKKQEVSAHEIRAVAQSHIQNWTKFIVDVSIELVATFFLEIEKNDGFVRVNVKKTMKSFMKSLRDIDSFVRGNDRLEKLFILTNPDHFQSDAKRHRSQIHERLVEISGDLTALDFIPPKEIKVKKNAPTGPVTYVPTEFHTLVSYAAVELEQTQIGELHQYRGLTSYARTMVELYGHPDVFESPTGSDTYVAQMALFRALLETGILEPDHKVVELAAGRGDGNYALQHLGISVKSYGRLDNFTQVYRNPAVELRTDYDLFKVETLPGLTEYDLVHIDISFAKGSSSAVGDLLLHLESQSLTYCLRMNSIDFSQVKEQAFESLPEYQRWIYYSDSGVNRTYPIYLVGRPGESMKPLRKQTARYSSAFRQMATSFSTLHHRRSLYSQGSPGLTNSLTMELSIGDNVVDTIKKIVIDSTSKIGARHLNRVADFLKTEEQMVIYSGNIVQRNKKLYQISESSWVANTQRAYELDISEDITHKNPQRETSLRQHLTQIHDHPTSCIRLRIPTAVPEGFELVKLESPVKRLRSMAASFEYVKKMGLVNGDINIANVEAAHEGLKGRTVSLMGRYQRDFAAVITQMVSAAYVGSYKFGLFVLYKKWNNMPEDRSVLLRHILMYKMLGSFYDQIEQIVLNTTDLDDHVKVLDQEEIRKQSYRRSDVANNSTEVFDSIRRQFDDTFNSASIDELFGALSKALTFDLPDDSYGDDPIPERGMPFAVTAQATSQAMEEIDPIGLEPDGLAQAFEESMTAARLEGLTDEDIGRMLRELDFQQGLGGAEEEEYEEGFWDD